MRFAVFCDVISQNVFCDCFASVLRCVADCWQVGFPVPLWAVSPLVVFPPAVFGCLGAVPPPVLCRA